MNQRGRIVKVSGPLVVAEGIPGARMYDVVRVGKERLIGEILEIRSDKASIQVYEETGGLKPGEPVESTYRPLSVELAPGLLGNIYDGIQRPLDLIRAERGDFIDRGIETKAIGREKEWEFEPGVKEGEEVTAGDILGVVQETEIVEHRIMVPFGIKGKVIKIHSGKARVEDTIAVIKTDKGERKVSMITRWPVRRMRPYKQQLDPKEPLITGQRVIDTFFPIAKGGTACIPGPFGSGKCVSGNTPVALGDGALLTMEELYRRSLEKGRARSDGIETIVELNPSLSLFSLNTSKIEKSTSSIFYKGKSEVMFRIKTRSGRLIEITPSHKLFKFGRNGDIIQTEAENLKVGDFIAAARWIRAENEEANFDLYQLSEARVIDVSIREKISQILRDLRRERGLSSLGISKVTVESLIYKRNLPSLSLTKKIYSYVGLSLPVPQWLRGARWGQPIHIPTKFSPELGELIGLFVAEGYIRTENTAVFTNEEEELLEQFNQLVKDIFHIETRIERQKGKAPNVLVHNKVFVDFLKKIGADGNSSQKRIPDLVLRSSDETIASFVKGYYLGDGSISQGEIELCTASKKLQIQLSYVLTRLGVLYCLRNKRTREKDYYRIFIRGIDNLRKVYGWISEEKGTFNKIERIKDYIVSKKTTYTSYDIIPLSSETISDLYHSSEITYSQLKDQGIEISNYIGNGERMSLSIFKRFIHLLTKNNSNKTEYRNFSRLASLSDYIFWDRIVSVERIKGLVDVYDVCVPQRENFVGGWGGIILHNTVVQHQLSKWADADIIVFVGCGERGNEMADVLRQFPRLKDPKSGKPLMQRTILIANTSNMPVAARESSIYTGITLAEYYRDMGYDVALMADSTSRWAEALREMSGRLEEIPAEEGYPAYLSSRLAEFYERAGRVICLGKDEREASLTAIGAVSPPGGDLSEPVTQATLRVVRVFWALVSELAYQRHFPAIHWLRSYSLYIDNLRDYFAREVAPDWMDLRNRAIALLQREDELKETVRLVGLDVLSDEDRIAMEMARSLREDFLQQFAFHEVDTHSPIKKQYLMLRLIFRYYDLSLEVLKRGAALNDLISLSVREDIARAKYIPSEKVGKEIGRIEKKLKDEIDKLIGARISG